MKNIQNNTLYTVQTLHLSLFSFLSKVFLTKLVSLIFSVHSLTSESTNFFSTLTMNNLNIQQYHKIYRIHTHNYLDSN